MAAFSTVFRISFRPEVACDVVSGINVGHVDVDVSDKFGDSSSNGLEIYDSEAVGDGIFGRI